jgi:hypothetical protein
VGKMTGEAFVGFPEEGFKPEVEHWAVVCEEL